MYADFLSKFRDRGDIMLDRNCFVRLVSRLRVLMGIELAVDRFASEWNAQLPRFWCWMQQPRAEGVDALRFAWSRSDWSWAFPPFSLISRLWAKVQAEECRVVLLIPYWSHEFWWSLFFSGEPGRVQWREPVRAVYALRAVRGAPTFWDFSRSRTEPRPWFSAAPFLVIVCGPRGGAGEPPPAWREPWLLPQVP